MGGTRFPMSVEEAESFYSENVYLERFRRELLRIRNEVTNGEHRR